ncbi:MAG: helix-turn-helix transcriptional regulator [Sphingobium sp.]|nr:helix-turn-helix transcriptional regulator [Sphingobium sp.]
MEQQGWGDRFLGAALEPHLWRDLLDDMARATGSSHGQLIGFGPAGAAFNWVSGIDEDLLQSSGAMTLNTPDRNFRMAADRLRDASPIRHEAHYDLVRDTLRDDDYLDMCADLDIGNGCQARLLAEGDGMIGLAVLRSEREGRSTREQQAAFAGFAAQAQVAVRMQRAIEQQGFALLSDTLGAMDQACWLLDETGRVGGMTPRAEQLLSSSRLVLEDGFLASRRADETRRIVRALRAALAEGGLPADPIAMPDEEDGLAMMLELFPLPRRPWALPFAPRAIITARVGALADRHGQALVRAFRLTRAEADIVLRIAGGASRRDVAAARGVSAETLKAQLRSIYDKTGCNRESQLVRVVNLISG